MAKKRLVTPIRVPITDKDFATPALIRYLLELEVKIKELEERVKKLEP